jgi:hypothetical protein
VSWNALVPSPDGPTGGIVFPSYATGCTGPAGPTGP